MKEKRALPIVLKTFSYGQRLGLFYAIAHLLVNCERKDQDKKLISGERSLKYATYKMFKSFSDVHPTKKWRGASLRNIREIEQFFKIRIYLYVQRANNPSSCTVYRSSLDKSYPRLSLAITGDFKHFQIISDLERYKQKKYICQFCWMILRRSKAVKPHERRCKLKPIDLPVFE